MSEDTLPSANNTYHCLCTTLILATKHHLSKLPRRSEPGLDRALILVLSSSADQTAPHSTIHNVNAGRKRTVIRREDGFEKRLLLRCTRCKLVIGYKLDEAQFQQNRAAKADGVIYLLPGGLVSTDEMRIGKVPEMSAWD